MATKTKNTKAQEPAVSMPKKATEEDKELQKKLSEFITLSLPEMMEQFGDLTINKKWDVIFQLLPYTTAKMQAVEVNGGLDIDPLSTQLGKLAHGISK